MNEILQNQKGAGNISLCTTVYGNGLKLATEIKNAHDHLDSFRWKRKVRNLSRKKSRWGDTEVSFMLLLKNFIRKWYLTLPKVSRVQGLSLKVSISQQLPKIQFEIAPLSITTRTKKDSALFFSISSLYHNKFWHQSCIFLIYFA